MAKYRYEGHCKNCNQTSGSDGDDGFVNCSTSWCRAKVQIVDTWVDYVPPEEVEELFIVECPMSGCQKKLEIFVRGGKPTEQYITCSCWQSSSQRIEVYQNHSREMPDGSYIQVREPVEKYKRSTGLTRHLATALLTLEGVQRVPIHVAR